MVRHAGSWRSAALACAVVLALATAPPPSVDAAGPAQWTPAVNWAAPGSNAYAVHMVLMAGDGSNHHSRILWFRGHGGAGLQGGEWGWQPGNESCASYPSGSFTALSPPDPLVDIFCSGHAGLWDGRIVLPGGTQPGTGTYGENASRVFTPGTGSSPGTWSNPGNLAERRWYPTATTLRDGRVSALGGLKYPQQRIHGGRIDGAAPTGGSGDIVRRFNPIVNGSWDAPVLPLEDPNVNPRRPDPRESHTAVDLTPAGGAQVWFGGRRANGAVLNDVWRLERPNGENVTAADYTYKWVRANPVVQGGILPAPRAEHTGVYDHVNRQMLVFGGCDALGNPVDARVWRLWWNTDLNPDNYQWDEVIISGIPPAARFAHTAFFDQLTLSSGATVNRMIVYGGATAAGTAPTDQKVYELRFSSASQAAWSEMPETTLPGVTAKPAPRMGHASGVGTFDRATPGHALQSHTAYVYGGQIPAGEYSDTLWTMWLIKDGTYAWQMRTTTEATSGASPGPRARFSLVADPAQGGSSGTQGPRLYLFGGDNAGVLADRFMHVIDPYRSDASIPAWEGWDAGDVATTRHAAVLDRGFSGYVHARVAEVYDPNAGPYGQWSSLPNANLLQHSYPLVFAVSGGSPSGGGRLFTPSAENDVAHYLDLPAAGGTSTSWVALANGAVGFAPQSGVLYGPNKVMVGGGRGSSGVVGTTRTRDVSNLSNPWVTSAAMTARYFHNLVLLPDGKVVVVGGNGTTNQNNDVPIYHPQIWDPAGNGGLGTWTAPGALPVEHDVARLPFDRAAAARRPGAGSGRREHGALQGFSHQKYTADIFCPPYLFNADGSPATRPAFQWSPRQVSFGQTFIVGVNSTANVAGMCLVRPAATTHGFDENQRFVPLSYALTALNAPGGTYYKVTVPADSSIVPPGDYLLFVLNAGGTPSIARWVRVGRTNGSASQPTAVTDLHRQCSDGTSVTLLWTPPGTDAGDPVPAPAQGYDIRYRTSAMNTRAAFDSGTAAANPPTPGDPTVNTEDNVTISGLSLGQAYWFRLAAKNHASGSGNWSALSNEISFVVHDEECGGSGGGGGGGGYQEGASVRPGAERNSAAYRRPGPGTADSTFLENTLLPNAPPGVARRDLVRLPFGPRWTDQGALARLSRAGRRATHFARVRLLAVDHAPGEAVFARGGEPVAGVTHDPLRVTHADGRDLTDVFLAGGAFAGRDGDTLYADLGADGPGALALSSSRAQLVRAPDRTGIDLACETAAGWVEVGHHEVRERSSDEVFDAPGLRRVRLVFRGVHRLEGVARFAPGPPASVTAHAPIAAEHSRLGEVADLFAAGEGTTLAPGDHVLVDFAASPPAEGATREWFLEVTGAHLEAAGLAQGARLSGEPAPRPAAFALAAIRPNPSAGPTTVEFDLPRSAHVRVEVFDVLGRRVASLVDGALGAGRHAVAWDGATATGARARAGVYLCRLNAGEFSARRTLVLRP